jgi:membrane protein implicated in regulation of membrane protease activity
MSWWSWVIGGAVLLGAELAFVDAQFYLVFVGSAALAAGLVTLMVPSISAWAQWAIFAALAIVSMAWFRSRIYGLLRGHPPSVHTGPVGGVLTLPVALAPGDSCQTEHGGTFWTVRNDGSAPIPPGGQARIVGVQGLTLTVRPDSKASWPGVPDDFLRLHRRLGGRRHINKKNLHRGAATTTIRH